jgi:hypothetical protein
LVAFFGVQSRRDEFQACIVLDQASVWGEHIRQRSHLLICAETDMSGRFMDYS